MTENNEKSDIWTELLENFATGLEKTVSTLKTRDAETIPGAKDLLIRRFEDLHRYLPRENGKLLIKSIDESIAEAFFPREKSLDKAFAKILKSLKQQYENTFIINELINGFVVSQSKAFGSFHEGLFIDRIIEAFKKSRTFSISDHSFYSMFGNPDKPKETVSKQLDQIADFLGFIIEERVIEKDLAHSMKKVIRYYKFSSEIESLLENQYFTRMENGEVLIGEDFDKNVFTSLFLARYAVRRQTLDSYKINGICAIFALILILSFMPKVKLAENHPILRDPNYNPDTMSVIPKSWMMKTVLLELISPLIEIIAFRLGATNWFKKIETSDAKKRLHLQSMFLLKDVNKWILGNLCRVEIPIFIEISNIFQEIVVSEQDSEK